MGSSTSRTRPKLSFRRSQSAENESKPNNKSPSANTTESPSFDVESNKRLPNNNSSKRTSERNGSEQSGISQTANKEAWNCTGSQSDPNATEQTNGVAPKPISLDHDLDENSASKSANKESKDVKEGHQGCMGLETSQIVENPANLSPHSPVANETKEKFEAVSIQELYNYLNDGMLVPCICDTSYMLIIDTRDKKLYDKSHILMAKHSKTLYTDLQSYSLYGFMPGSNLENLLNEFTFVIVYGNRIIGNNIGDTPEVKLFRELESYGVEPYLLTAGFDAFYDAFPFMCNKKQFIRPDDYKKIQTYPSMVLPNQLYQGRGNQATNRQIIKDLKLTHIVNISQEHASAFPDDIEYLTLKLDDVPQTQLINYLEKSTKFLTEAIDNGGRVLVHCNMGVSRSSTITLAYLMKAKGWSLRAAFDFLKERRKCVRPNRGFLQQLSTWEEMVLGKKYTDADDLWLLLS